MYIFIFIFIKKYVKHIIINSSLFRFFFNKRILCCLLSEIIFVLYFLILFLYLCMIRSMLTNYYMNYLNTKFFFNSLNRTHSHTHIHIYTHSINKTLYILFYSCFNVILTQSNIWNFNIYWKARRLILFWYDDFYNMTRMICLSIHVKFALK